MARSAALGQAPPRPQPPPPFVGQQHVVDYFRCVGSHALSHAYLFYGPRGVGKRTFAKLLGLTLHCERPTSFPIGYCGECAACHRGIAGSSGDTILVDQAFIRRADEVAGKAERKTDALGIETSRLMIRMMEMRSYEGGRLICVVPDFDRATGDHPYNALLKELEEPDPGKLFLLTAERPELVLPTIRSRTFGIRFASLREEDIGEQLARHYGENPQKAAVLARRAQGSLGDALAERADEQAALRQQVRRWVFACISQPAVLPPMPALGRDDPRSALDEVLRQTRLTLRDLMACAACGSQSVLDLEVQREYKKICGLLGESAAAKTVKALGAADEAVRIAATNVPPPTILGWLQIQLRSAAF